MTDPATLAESLVRWQEQSRLAMGEATTFTEQDALAIASLVEEYFALTAKASGTTWLRNIGAADCR